jgi:enoyl-[acyl-carrier protein] reductase II
MLMESVEDYLEQLWSVGKAFLGVRYAILGGAMTWVSERNLVSAISNAGAFGVIASGAMSPDVLRKEIQGTQALTKHPFGVNLITLHPQLMDLIDVCAEENISHVVLAGGLPPSQAITKLKDKGLKVLCFSPALVLAKKLIKLGVDALIIEGMEAGGHIGPVSTSVLVQEILPHIREVPIFVAGGIGRGEAITSYLKQGAAGCQLGTRFVCATEALVLSVQQSVLLILILKRPLFEPKRETLLFRLNSTLDSLLFPSELWQMKPRKIFSITNENLSIESIDKN